MTWQLAVPSIVFEVTLGSVKQVCAGRPWLKLRLSGTRGGGIQMRVVASRESGLTFSRVLFSQSVTAPVSPYLPPLWKSIRADGLHTSYTSGTSRASWDHFRCGKLCGEA